MVSKFVVEDPRTARDNVHRAYDPAEDGDKPSNTPDASFEHGNDDTAAEARLILKTIPFGVGTLVTTVSDNNTKTTKLCSSV